MKKIITTVWLIVCIMTGFVNQTNAQGMKINETAQKNLEVLWPDYQMKVKTDDPELTEIFSNFAFGEVIADDDMDVKLRIMIITASTIASQGLSAYRLMVDAALNVGASPVEIKEIVYQAVPYLGISKVIDFIDATNEIFKERQIALPLAGQSVTSPETRFEKGLALQKELFGNSIENNYKNSPEDLIHIQQYLSANCFGDYVIRNGLDAKTREMITLSFLIALGGAEAQVKGHIQGNLNVGNDRRTLINLMTQLIPYVGYPRTLNAINCLNEVAPAK